MSDEGLLFRAIRRVDVGRIGVIMPNKAVVEALAIGFGGALIWLLALYFDAMDQLIEVMDEHESWELDEILLQWSVSDSPASLLQRDACLISKARCSGGKPPKTTQVGSRVMIR